MELWGKDDTFSRWVNAIVAILLMLLALFEIYALFHFTYATWRLASSLPCTYLAYRCLFYAITGRNNINRDDF